MCYKIQDLPFYMLQVRFSWNDFFMYSSKMTTFLWYIFDQKNEHPLTLYPNIFITQCLLRQHTSDNPEVAVGKHWRQGKLAKAPSTLYCQNWGAPHNLWFVCSFQTRACKEDSSGEPIPGLKLRFGTSLQSLVCWFRQNSSLDIARSCPILAMRGREGYWWGKIENNTSQLQGVRTVPPLALDRRVTR